MVKMDDAVIARYEHAGHRFEILVDPDLALELKRGNKVNFDELLAIDSVYKDSGKGEEASLDLVKKTFGTEEIGTITKKIIEDGSIQLTTEHRRRMLENRRKEIVNFISNNAIDPKTNAPHPPQRIENAMEELRVQADLFRPTGEQVQEIVKKMKVLMPITIKNLRVAVKIPAEYAGKASPVLHKYSPKKQEWQNDGSIVALFDLPVGMKARLFDDINRVTHGNAETKLLEAQ